MKDQATLYIDGASSGNPGPSGIGAVLYDEQGSRVKTLSKYIGHATNNFSEYIALLYGLQEVLILGYRSVIVNTDSELVARQINGEYKVKDTNLKLIYNLIRHLIKAMSSFKIRQIERGENKEADRLASRAIKEQVG